MGGCLDQPKPKKKPIAPPPAPQTIRMSASRYDLAAQLVKKQSEVYLKYKKMSLNELLITYKIQSTLQTSSKMQGPKYLSNLVDGSSKILRVVTLSDIDQKRLGIYKNIIGFEVYQNDEGTLMLLDQFCSGQDFYEIMLKFKDNPTQLIQKQLFKAFKDVCSLIGEFHRNKIWLGNLNLSSFKKISPFEDTMRLVDFNFSKNVTQYQKMGFAHKESYEADYEFVGYLLQFLVFQQPPIFIPHKLTYVEFNTIPHFSLIQKLLKGKKWTEPQLSAIKHTQIINNQRMVLGYKFRRDVNKLLKMRKKRRGHNRKFYGDDAKSLINEFKFQEDAVYRYQSQRIFTKIEFYIDLLNSFHQEAFLNYSGNNQNLRRLKEVFMLTDSQKKMNELKQCLSTIK